MFACVCVYVCVWRCLGITDALCLCMKEHDSKRGLLHVIKCK